MEYCPKRNKGGERERGIEWKGDGETKKRRG